MPISSPAAEVSIDNAIGSADPALAVRSESGAAGPVLQQMLSLTPGMHTLAAEVSGENAASIRFDIQCAGGPHLDVTPLPATRSGTSMVLRFAVPATCDTQWLRVVLNGEGVSGDLRLDNVVVR